MWQVLGGPGKAHLHEPEALKYLLAPVVAKSVAEQERFYEIFDHYYEEISAPLIPEREGDKGQTGWRRIPVWAWWALSGVSLAVAAALIILSIPGTPDAPVMNLEMKQPFIRMGEPMEVMNVSRNIDTTARFRWELLDAMSKRVEQADSSDYRSWTFTVDTLGEGARKLVRFSWLLPDTTLRQSSEIRLQCADPPEIAALGIPRQAEAGERLEFSAEINTSQPVNYLWEFGDGDSSTLASPRHTYAEAGSYTVSVTVSRSGEPAGFCLTRQRREITVGAPKVNLPYIPLQRAEVEPFAAYSWGAWILLGAIGLGIIFYWVRWFGRPAIAREEDAVATEKFRAQDRAPYFIPFRSQHGFVPVGREQLKLADALRLRQEGRRRQVDVPASVNATIERGGFPVLHFGFSTQPTEYLFLIDEQSAESHQARLFQHLVAVLRDQDVYVETFYYRDTPRRVWNARHPGGLKLELLHRTHPQHRLMVLGDGHELLSPYAPGRPQLRESLAADLRRWPQRFLFTPLPPANWTYRECTLAELFVLFPSDLAGQTEAAKFIEGGLEPEDLPVSFQAWQERLAEERREPNPLYFHWKRYRDHEKYLAEHPELLRWVQALAVWPTPNWNTTVAIGRALGIDLTYDKLLLLSRIGWLQRGELRPRLRRELLDRLDAKDERLARAAVREELLAVADQTWGGSANTELQSQLAVQDFALQPEEAETRATIRYLLDHGLINQRQQAELERTVNRQMPVKKGDGNGIGIREYLDEEKPEAQRPVNTPDFRRAVALTASFILLALLVWTTGHTDWLYRTVFGEAPAAFVEEPDRQMRNYFFVEEGIYVDSTAIYNNWGVNAWNGRGPLLAVTSFRNPAYPDEDYDTYRNPLRLADFVEDLLQTTFVWDGRPGTLARGQRLLIEGELAPSITDVPAGVVDQPGYRDLNTDHDLQVVTETLLPLRAAINHNARYTGEEQAPLLNAATLYYNLGIQVYQAYLLDSLAAADLQNSLAFFHRALAPDVSYATAAIEQPLLQLQAQSRHALGLSHYYLGKPDSARYYYNALLETDFFDTTRIAPNLANLFGDESARIMEITVVGRTRASLTASINYYVDEAQHPKVLLTLTAVDGRGNPVRRLSRPSLELEPGEKIAELTINYEPGGIAPSSTSGLNGAPQKGYARLGAVSDSLRAQLVDLDTRRTIARRSIPYPKEWREDNGSFPANEERMLRGRVFDGKNLLPDVQVRLSEETPAARAVYDETVTTDEAGIYEFVLPDRSLDNPVLQFRKPGYETQRRPLKYREEDGVLWVDNVFMQEADSREVLAPEMVFVAGGAFTMGCVPGRDVDAKEECPKSELPAHEPRLDDFYIGKYEVTNREYAEFLNAYGATEVQSGPYAGQTMIEEHEWGLQRTGSQEGPQWAPAEGYENHPVIYVSWYGAYEYARWLSNQTGQNYRLPTEAEWEYAARGGQSGLKDQFRYAGGNDPDAVAWYRANSVERSTYQVGTLQPNQLDLYDMSGNVWEWCGDVWHENYQGAPADGSAWTEGGEQDRRVVRGGSWIDDDNFGRVSARSRNDSGNRYNLIGFRLARY